MATLKERIQSDLRAAMLARDEPRKAALRMLTAAIKNAEIESRGELAEGDLLVVVQRQVKQRRERASRSSARAAARTWWSARKQS